MVHQSREKKDFHVSWYIIFYKFSFGLIEVLLGIGIILFGHQALQIYQRLITQELSEDPHDVLVRLTASTIPNLLTHNTYLVIYLLLLGAAKIAGSIGLLYKKNWGVDVLVLLTVILFPFQLIHLFTHPSIFDVIYMILGIIIALYLISFNPRSWIAHLEQQLFNTNRLIRPKE